MNQSVCTEHLELISATHQILTSDLNDRTELARLLNAEIPAAWPPQLMDANVIREFIRMSADLSGPVFAAWYWVLDKPAAGSRVLIGNGGILGAGSGADTVVLGYSVLDAFQNHGYATEAIRTLVPEIFALHGVRRIIATTYPDIRKSIRVLEKNGFTRSDQAPVGTGAEEGTVCFVLEKP
jgi:[ribosomal protein S5]-alanine N-acetyltransferase